MINRNANIIEFRLIERCASNSNVGKYLRFLDPAIGGEFIEKHIPKNIENNEHTSSIVRVCVSGCVRYGKNNRSFCTSML